MTSQAENRESTEAQTNEEGRELTAEELASISGGVVDPHTQAPDGTPWAPSHTGQGSSTQGE